MPKCEVCEYRFVCYTLASNERPKKVTVNWRIQNTCGDCKHVVFGTKARGYTTTTRPVGYCEVAKMIVHKNSAICCEENFMPLRVAKIDKLYGEIREVIALKNKKTKLPRYCVEE